MQPSPPSARFRTLAVRLRDGDARVGLAEAALVLAGEFERDLDPGAALTELDRLARAADRVVPAEGTPALRVGSLVDFLHAEVGFRGNEESYEDPRNSFLDVVLTRRTGIPITLAIVHAEVAARIGLALRGVSFPGHFLLRTEGEPPLVIDAFHGRLLDRRECETLLRHALGPKARLEPRHLATASTADVVIRMLGNLKHSHAGRGDWLRALDCVERILLVSPEAASELRDRGLLWEKLECFGPALEDLERFLALAPDAPEAGAIRARVAALRTRAAAIH